MANGSEKPFSELPYMRILMLVLEISGPICWAIGMDCDDIHRDAYVGSLKKRIHIKIIPFGYQLYKLFINLH
jgi:hypothetical protein